MKKIIATDFFFHVALISEEVEREDIQEDYGRGGAFLQIFVST